MKNINRAILIDDEKFDQMAYRRLLKGMPEIGEIVSFQYADDALDHFKQTERVDGDVIFLDINMPRMNGFEFLEEANRAFGDTLTASVVVMLTTSLNPSDVARASAYSSVKAFINKPLTKTHIRDVCAMPRHLKQNRFNLHDKVSLNALKSLISGSVKWFRFIYLALGFFHLFPPNSHREVVYYGYFGGPGRGCF